MLPRSALAGLVLLLSIPPASAQVEHGGRPPSQLGVLRKPVPTARMLPVRADLLLAEDAQPLGLAQAPDEAPNKPLRFAEVLAVDLDLASSGAWEDLPGGGRVWRLRIHSPGAKSLALVFARYQLPAGGELYVYDDARKEVRGAYTEHEHRPDGQFAMRPLRGEALTLEYFEPAGAPSAGEIRISAVAHDYRGILDWLEPEDRSGGGGSNCEVNVACPLGATWQTEKNACVRILSLSAGAFCTGSLLNNTANDGTLLVLTAAHCGGLISGVFTFNFELNACRQGLPSQGNAITGSIPLVTDESSDVQLVRIVAPQGPMAFPVHLAGWDRSDTVPAVTTLIHHPGGEPKKISRDSDPPTQVGKFWRILDWEFGISEGGSSGAPLFDPNHRFIGNLDSGSSSCPVPTNDFCTRLAAAWPALAPFLDPLGTGQVTLDGLDLGAVTPRAFEVTGMLPAQIPVVDPTPAKSLRVLGNGFPATYEVLVNGIVLNPFFYSRSGHSFLNINMPPLPAGKYDVAVRDGATTVFVPFKLDVATVTQPIMQTGFGIPNEQVFSQFGIDTFHADVPGHVHYCFFSLSNIPSVDQYISLDIGNNFTNIRGCQINPVPSRGYVKVHHRIRPSYLPLGTVVYNQSVCVSHGRRLVTSNVQQTVFQF